MQAESAGASQAGTRSCFMYGLFLALQGGLPPRLELLLGRPLRGCRCGDLLLVVGAALAAAPAAGKVAVSPHEVLAALAPALLLRAREVRVRDGDVPAAPLGVLGESMDDLGGLDANVAPWEGHSVTLGDPLHYKVSEKSRTGGGCARIGQRSKAYRRF